jgi:lipopolysaccharide/colanic/teichoic acid biosynthesis glycosyltransferase
MSARRIVDIVIAAIALAVLAPLLVVVGVFVRSTSPGPVLFRQRRVGEGGRLFDLLKFRTMWDGTRGPRVTRVGDARVTPVGGYLRCLKLDELPQFVNVLRGDMTLVGPRPEVPEYLARLGVLGNAYAAVRPGLADAATLAFYDEGALLAQAPDPERYYLETILPAKARLSITYARQRSLTTDIRLFLALVRRVVGLRPSTFPLVVPTSPEDE